MSELAIIRTALKALADPEHAAISRRFFKTGPGEYAEGDRFLGIRVPRLRKLAKAHRAVSLKTARALLGSGIHEERHLALFILIHRYNAGDARTRERIFRLYLANTDHINNWDLVDASAEHIVGHYLLNRDKAPLARLSRSKDLWERRISILATFGYIKQGQFDITLEIAETLLTDTEDLIHKAVGWMLREVGNRNQSREEAFLKRHYPGMPRTMLRYAIEKFPESLRQAYLKGTV